MKQKHHIFHTSLYGTTAVLVLGLYILGRGGKSKEEFSKAEGSITYLEKTYDNLPIRNAGKYRFLQLNSLPRVFEIFVGKGAGDFKPKLERIDELKVGDEITVYFDENSRTENDKVNSLVQFIDREQQPFFIRGNADLYLGGFCIGAGALIIAVLFILKFKEIIE